MLIPVRDHNPSGRPAYVTWVLLVLNLLIFLAYFPGAPTSGALTGLFAEWGMVPARLSAGDGYATLVTHQFLHGGYLHLASNLLFLWIFGDNMEEVWGPARFLLFYLGCGIAAGLVQYAAAPQSVVPMVGASGAIAGVLGAYMLFYPRARIDMFLFLLVYFRVIPIPAWVVLGAWFAMQVLGGLSAAGDGGGVAHWAHAGGFVAGLAATLPVWVARGGRAVWARSAGQPPHPAARYRIARTNVPAAGRRRRNRPRGPWDR